MLKFVQKISMRAITTLSFLHNTIFDLDTLLKLSGRNHVCHMSTTYRPSFKYKYVSVVSITILHTNKVEQDQLMFVQNSHWTLCVSWGHIKAKNFKLQGGKAGTSKNTFRLYTHCLFSCRVSHISHITGRLCCTFYWCLSAALCDLLHSHVR